MARNRTNQRRFLLPLVLAAILAGETAGLAIAAHTRPADANADRGVGIAGAVARVHAPGWIRSFEGLPDRERAATSRDAASPSIGGIGEATGATDRTRPSLGRGATDRPAIDQAARATTSLAARYAGRNHVWIPALGIDRSLAAFPCSRTRPPDDLVYRWGCAGRNNVYLLGHAHSVFKPLHDAYVGGRLRKGTEVVYADGAGTVRTYAVSWWKLTRPTAAASWAWAAQPTPSMTLQTCVGAASEYRLMVRLLATD